MLNLIIIIYPRWASNSDRDRRGIRYTVYGIRYTPRSLQEDLKPDLEVDD